LGEGFLFSPSLAKDPPFSGLLYASRDRRYWRKFNAVSRRVSLARIRTIKPEFWQDEDLASLSAESNLLAIGLLNQADDEGYFKANPALLKAAIFPLRETSLSTHCMLTELSNIGYLELFEGSDGKQYGLVKNFLKHQKINRPTASKYKALREFTEDSVSAHQNVSGEGKGKEGKGKEVGAQKFKVPEVKELVEYLIEKQVPNPEPLANKFINFYASKGWLVGKSKMRSWKHAIAGNDWIKDHSEAQASVMGPRSMRGTK
jgi:DNA replication protein DnaT